jgi:hypothetical protein
MSNKDAISLKNIPLPVNQPDDGNHLAFDNATKSFKWIGLYIPVTSADAAAPNNSIYYSSDASKLVYKDPGGTVRNLY